MPFMGKDWRSPGEAWVKTESLGWQRMKLIESQLSPSGFCHQGAACSWPPKTEYGQHMVHHCNLHLPTHDNTRDSTSSPGSSDSGRGDSVSPSPTSSPEKTAVQNHHLFPLAFSSPYGSYSVVKNCNHQASSMNNSSLSKPFEGKVTHCHHLNGATVTTAQSNESTLVMMNQSKNPTLVKTNAIVDDGAICDNQRLSKTAETREDIDNPTRKSKHSYKNVPSITVDNKFTEAQTPNAAPQYKPGDNLAKDLAIIDLQTPSSDCNKENLDESDPLGHTCNLIHTANKSAPFCPISIRTREVAIYNTISEAFYRLDFCNAVHDIRRFNYVCKLLHLLITQNLTSLGGCATKVLFNMLEQIAREVSTNKRNIHVLKNLLNELKLMLQNYSCWGRPIGSRQLWQQHSDTIERISRMVDNIELSPPQASNQSITFNELPVEMIREIILRLNDHRDLISSARASPVMKAMIVSQNIWERLCRYHFTEQQVKMVLECYKKTPIDRRPRNYYVRTNSAELRKQTRRDSSNKFRSSKDRVTNLALDCSQEDCESEQSSSLCGINRAQSNRTKNTNTSIVTRTRKIFDSNQAQQAGQQQQLSTRRRSSTENIKRFKHNNNKANEESDHIMTTTTATNDNISKRHQHKQSTNQLDQNHELDWEDVFHQLRKKFDLKEEYADCLLLCRHCRCLFWKSIGHPCIQGDETCLYQLNRSDTNLSVRSEQSTPGINNNRNQQSVVSDNRRQRRFDSSSSNIDQAAVGQSSSSNQNRISVAALSRNFDNRSRNLLAANRDAQPGNNLGDFRLNNNQIDNRLNRNRLEQNNNANSNANKQGKRRIDDLVPKHVAISPQAFLKFFSL